MTGDRFVGVGAPQPEGVTTTGSPGQRTGPARGAALGTSRTTSGSIARGAPRGRPRRPHTRHERALADEGFEVVVGLDEVGRGAWAGPVSVGVVVFPRGRRAPTGLRDSKELSEPDREALFPRIVAWCDDWSVGHAEAIECDRLGMTAALRLAATRALAGLRQAPHAILMDGNFDYVSPPTDTADACDPDAADPDAADPAGAGPALFHVRTVVRGDSACVSIAAASVLAKVTRDRHMRELSPSFPAFDFHRNKGYPSPVHRRALDGQGLTSLHRRSWSYVEGLAFR